MRAIIQLNDYDPEGGQEDGQPYDPHHDTRSIINGVETEWYPGSGNIHVIDPAVEQVAEVVSGGVIIDHESGLREVENASLVTVYSEAFGDNDHGLQHTLGFERRVEDDGYNQYVFKTERGKVLELSPGATVSELQNRI